MAKVDIEKLLKAQTTIKSATVQAAVDQMVKSQTEQQVDALKSAIIAAQGFTASKVAAVRAVRKQEKQAEEELQRFADAEAMLMATGSIREFVKVLFPKSTADQDYFLRNNSGAGLSTSVVNALDFEAEASK